MYFSQITVGERSRRLLKTAIIIYLIKTYKISQPSMRLQVMAREGFLHKVGKEVAAGTTLGEQWALCYRYTFLHLPRVPPVLVTVRLVFSVSLLTTGWLLRRLFLVVARAAGVV